MAGEGSPRTVSAGEDETVAVVSLISKSWMVSRALPLLALSLVGCAATVRWNDHGQALRLGMTKRQAHALLGDPQDITVQRTQALLLETWKYVDRTLTFQDDVLQSWTQP